MVSNRNQNLRLQLDFRSGLPVYLQLVRQVEQQASGGRLLPGDQLPTVRGLAEELGINFNTVARAYRVLRHAGIVSSQPGRGTFVIEKKPLPANKRSRKKALQALAGQYIGEAKLYQFSASEIKAMVRIQLRSWKEPEQAARGI